MRIFSTPCFVYMRPSNKNIIRYGFISFLLFLTAIPSAAENSFNGQLQSVSITDASSTNNPPNASFMYSKDANSFTFDATQSSDSDGAISTYQWDFGDGNTAVGVRVTHTYATQADYPVTLTVIDNEKAATLTQRILISAECEASPFIDVNTQDGSVQLITHDFYTYAGGQYTGDPAQLCKAEFRISAWLGDISNKVYEARVYTANGTSLNKIKANGVSTKLIGSKIINNTDTYYEFTFDPPVEINPSDIVVITEVSTDQSVDTGNFIRLYRSSVTNSDMNFGTWMSSGNKSALYDSISPAVKLYKLSK